MMTTTMTERASVMDEAGQLAEFLPFFNTDVS